MVAVDAPGTVERFGDDNAHQRVRQGEFAERPAFVRERFDVRSDAFRAADDEGELAVVFLPMLQACGEAFAAVFAAGDVEGDDVVAGVHGAADLRRFFVLRSGELARAAALL